MAYLFSNKFYILHAPKMFKRAKLCTTSRLSIREMYRNLCENCTENVKPMGETGSIGPLTAYFEA